MIIALGGSCCSSCCSMRNSRDRWTVRPDESLSVVAREVLTPQAVLSLTPLVSDSDSVKPVEWLRSLLRDRVSGVKGRKLLSRLTPRPRLRPDVSLIELDWASESDEPTVLV